MSDAPGVDVVMSYEFNAPVANENDPMVHLCRGLGEHKHTFSAAETGAYIFRFTKKRLNDQLQSFLTSAKNTGKLNAEDIWCEIIVEPTNHLSTRELLSKNNLGNFQSKDFKVSLPLKVIVQHMPVLHPRFCTDQKTHRIFNASLEGLSIASEDTPKGKRSAPCATSDTHDGVDEDSKNKRVRLDAPDSTSPSRNDAAIQEEVPEGQGTSSIFLETTGNTVTKWSENLKDINPQAPSPPRANQAASIASKYASVAKARLGAVSTPQRASAVPLQAAVTALVASSKPPVEPIVTQALQPLAHLEPPLTRAPVLMPNENWRIPGTRPTSIGLFELLIECTTKPEINPDASPGYITHLLPSSIQLKDLGLLLNVSLIETVKKHLGSDSAVCGLMGSTIILRYEAGYPTTDWLIDENGIPKMAGRRVTLWPGKMTEWQGKETLGQFIARANRANTSTGVKVELGMRTVQRPGSDPVYGRE